MSNAGRRAIILGLAAVLTALVATGGVWLFRRADPVAYSYNGFSPQVSTSAEPSPEVSESPSPSPSPSPSKKPSPKPKPKPSRAPVPNVPAPPPPPTKPSGCVPHYEGTNVARAEVGVALEAAAARRAWKPAEGDISLPTNLIKAVAEQESGWQSAIVSCVGAIGVMQVLPATGSWMNSRFGTSFDVREVQGNAMLGGIYLQWLTKYFGDAYFNRSYSLSCPDDPETPEPANREFCLLNTILSAYNLGHGTVEKELDDGDDTIYLNYAYIGNVRALMSRF